MRSTTMPSLAELQARARLDAGSTGTFEMHATTHPKPGGRTDRWLRPPPPSAPARA